jgi:uncharacterized RDD family membrane protein YckC
MTMTNRSDDTTTAEFDLLAQKNFLVRAEMSQKELHFINKLKDKLDLSNPAISEYLINNFKAKRTFKTREGFEFLALLQRTVSDNVITARMRSDLNKLLELLDGIDYAQLEFDDNLFDKLDTRFAPDTRSRSTYGEAFAPQKQKGAPKEHNLALPADRLLAALLDILLFLLFTGPLTIGALIASNIIYRAIDDGGLFIYWIVPLACAGGFALWLNFAMRYWRKGTSLGKKQLGLFTVDFQTGEIPPLRTMIVRHTFGQVISDIYIGLGFLWILFDKNRQGWHDKISSTVVVKIGHYGMSSAQP